MLCQAIMNSSTDNQEVFKKLAIDIDNEYYAERIFYYNGPTGQADFKDLYKTEVGTRFEDVSDESDIVGYFETTGNGAYSEEYYRNKMTAALVVREVKTSSQVHLSLVYHCH